MGRIRRPPGPAKPNVNTRHDHNPKPASGQALLGLLVPVSVQVIGGAVVNGLSLNSCTDICCGQGCQLTPVVWDDSTVTVEMPHAPLDSYPGFCRGWGG